MLLVVAIVAAVAVTYGWFAGVKMIYVLGHAYKLWQVGLMAAGALASALGAEKLGALLGGVAGAAAGAVNFRTPGINGNSGIGGVNSFLASQGNTQQQSQSRVNSVSILGRVYTTYGNLHDAAIAALNTYNPVSRSINREHGGNICSINSPFYKGQVGRFVFTDAVGTVAGVDPDNAPCPTGTSRVGAWHTHGANTPGYANEVFSPNDRIWSNNNFALGVSALYLATPGRRVRLFIPAGVPGTTQGRIYPNVGRTQ